MNYLNLLHQAPTEIKSNLRELETLYQKSIKNKWSMTFNNVSLKENLLPKYRKKSKTFKSMRQKDHINHQILFVKDTSQMKHELLKNILRTITYVIMSIKPK